MNLDRIDALVMTLAGAERRFPFENSPDMRVYAVAGKWFAWTDWTSRPQTIQVKCDPDVSATLRATYPAIRPGYHMNKRHWITITLDGSVPDETILGIFEDAHDLIVMKLPRAMRAALLADPDR